MKVALVWRTAAAVLIAGGLFAFVLHIRQRAALTVQTPATAPAPETARTVPKRPFAFTSNHDCRKCHTKVAGECDLDEHGQAWFNGPFFPQDPKRTECVSCHASEPILEIGLDKTAVVRSDRLNEGIGCIECHRMNDTVHGPLATTEAACNPTFNRIFTDNKICAPCHAPHGTMDEWKNSEWGRKGVTCQACHMPEVERESSDGGPVRKVRTHRMLSQRNPEFLQKAVSVTAKIEQGQAVISIHNDNTGHNFPGEINNREVFLLTRMLDREGKELSKKRESMKTPARPQRGTDPSTQIKPGEIRVYRYDFPEGATKAEILLAYKLLFFQPDYNSSKVWSGELLR